MHKIILALLILLSMNLMGLEPLMLEKGKVLFKDDFSKSTTASIKKPRWWIKQHTRWRVEKGQLVGIPAEEEYQEKKRKIGKGHFGDIPRIGLGKLPKTYIMNFKFQIDDKAGDSKVPIIEFGHHVSRIYFSKEGAVLLTIDEKTEAMRHKEFKLKPFSWYEVLAEVSEEDLCIQIKAEDGKVSRFYCHEPRFKDAKNMSFGIATTLQGKVLLDDIKVWQKEGMKKSWQEDFGE